MAFKINTNVSALNAAAQASSSYKNMTGYLEKLSSGLRINKASDDASGMSIANSLRAQASVLGQSIKNANDTIGIIQIADKAMDEQITILNTIKEKATQAAQDGQTSKSRGAIQADITRLMQGLDAIASTTSYNGQKLLSSSYTGKEFQVGGSSNQTIKLSVGATSSDKIGHLRLETTSSISSSINLSCTTLNFKIADKSVGIAGVVISTSAGTGIGALADQINRNGYKIGIKAFANTVSTAKQSITAGDVKDLIVNGTTIGNIDNVKANDSDGRLVRAINSLIPQTGVSASVDEIGRLRLNSVDGRGIYIESQNRNKEGFQKAELALNPTGNYVNPEKVNDGIITAGFQITFNNSLTFTTTRDYSTSAGSGGRGPQSEFEEWLSGVVGKVTLRGDAFANSNRGFAINQYLDRQGGEGATITLRANGREIEEVLNIQNGSGSFGDGARIENFEGVSGELTLGEATVMHVVSAQASNFGRLSLRYQGASDITISARVECSLFENNSQSTINLKGSLGGWDVDTACAAGMFGNLIDASLQNGLIGSIGVSTLEGAMVVMDMADSAIEKLSSIRSDLGSAQLQTLSTLNNISITRVNVKAAESNIRDIDFGEVSSSFNKTMILSRSGSYALSQANIVQRNILLLFA